MKWLKLHKDLIERLKLR